MIDSDTEEFDLRNQITQGQLKDDESKYEMDQARLNERIKMCQLQQKQTEVLIDYDKEFATFKLGFNELINKINNIPEEIDHLNVEIEIALRKENYKKIEDYNNKIIQKRILLKGYTNELNQYYNKSTTLMAGLINQ